MTVTLDEYGQPRHNWKRHFLGELCGLSYGKNLPTSQLRLSGFPVFGANGVIGFHHIFQYEHSMVAVSCRGEYSSTVNMTPAKVFVTNNSIVCEVLDQTYVYDHFLFWSLSMVPRTSIVSGSAQPQVIIQDLGRAIIHVPPLPEQRRIAEILDTIDTAIQQTEALIAKLKVMKAGLLHDLLTRGLDENGQLRAPMAHPEWSEVILGHLLQAIRNGTTETQVDDKNPYPVTRIETISEEVIDRSRVKYLTKPEPNYLLRPGDILYSHINSLEHIGKVALYDDSVPLYHGMNLMLLRPHLAVVEPRFLHAVLSSELARAHARREAKRAINQVSLGQGEIKSLPINLPSLAEQRRIISTLEAHEARIRAEEAYFHKLKLLKKGLMHDLLTGKVRTVELATKDEEE